MPQSRQESSADDAESQRVVADTVGRSYYGNGAPAQRRLPQ